MGRRGELYSSIKAQLAPAGAPGHLLSPEALPGLLSGLLGEGKAGLPGGWGEGGASSNWGRNSAQAPEHSARCSISALGPPREVSAQPCCPRALVKSQIRDLCLSHPGSR